MKKLFKQCNYKTQIRWYLYSTLKCEFNQLSPTQATLKYKIFRSHYVTLVLRRGYLAITNLPSPLGHGCEAKDDVYVSIRTDELPVSLELMELIVCDCKTSRNTMRCKCIKNQLMCTDLCKCVHVRTMVHNLTSQSMMIAVKINFEDCFH